jgi:hypothetical protein
MMEILMAANTALVAKPVKIPLSLSARGDNGLSKFKRIQDQYTPLNYNISGTTARMLQTRLDSFNTHLQVEHEVSKSCFSALSPPRVLS